MSARAQTTVKIIGHKGAVDQHAYRSTVMAETMTAQPKLNATRGGSADKAALAQVEKWMAIIREVSGEKSKN
jgi:hypothetical protein